MHPHPLIWLLLLPFRLLGALLVALGYLLAFLLGLALLGGGTALTLSGKGAILGVPALVVGYLVLRELFDGRHRGAPPTPEPAPPPPAAPAPYHGYHPQPLYRSPHYRRQPAYYWVPGRWTVR